MLKAPDTVSIDFVRGMLSGVGHPHADCSEWLVDAGIDPRLLDRAASRVSVEQYVNLFVLLMDRRDDEFLGLLSRPFRRGGFAVIVRSILGTTTVGQALRRVCSTLALLQEDFELVQVREGRLAGLRIVFKSPRAASHPFLHELVLRVFWRLVAWLHGGRLKAARVDFAMAPPPYSAEYTRVFPGLLRFDQSHSTVWFDADSLDAKTLHDATAVRDFLAMSPRNVIVPQVNERALCARVRKFLQASSPEWPDLDATASSLHMAVSTLQRRLAAEGANFQGIKDHLRLEISLAHLSGGKTSLTALGRQLGFADSAAFQRAFKTWTGSAPGAYRRASAGK